MAIKIILMAIFRL